jgi:hypothetical protein
LFALIQYVLDLVDWLDTFIFGTLKLEVAQSPSLHAFPFPARDVWICICIQ